MFGHSTLVVIIGSHFPPSRTITSSTISTQSRTTPRATASFFDREARMALDPEITQVLEPFRRYLRLLAQVHLDARLRGKLDPSDLAADDAASMHRLRATAISRTGRASVDFKTTSER